MKVDQATLLYLRQYSRADAGARAHRASISAQRPAHQPILGTKKREQVVTEVISMLRRGRASVFEFEASCRHGLRAEFCRCGHGWHRSDSEAASIVAEGLKIIGANRPTWLEGQAEYTENPLHCIQCGGDFDESGEVTRSRRFCCVECASVWHGKNIAKASQHTDMILREAGYLIRRGRKEAVPCEWCGTPFHRHTSQHGQRFCSKECSGASSRSVPEVPCTHCGTMFKAEVRQKGARLKYCSPACRQANAFQTIINRSCWLCGCSFTTTNTAAKYCRPSHQVVAYQMKKGIVRPVKAMQPADPELLDLLLYAVAA